MRQNIRAYCCIIILSKASLTSYKKRRGLIDKIGQIIFSPFVMSQIPMQGPLRQTKQFKGNESGEIAFLTAVKLHKAQSGFNLGTTRVYWPRNGQKGMGFNGLINFPDVSSGDLLRWSRFRTQTYIHVHTHTTDKRNPLSCDRVCTIKGPNITSRLAPIRFLSVNIFMPSRISMRPAHTVGRSNIIFDKYFFKVLAWVLLTTQIVTRGFLSSILLFWHTFS